MRKCGPGEQEEQRTFAPAQKRERLVRGGEIWRRVRNLPGCAEAAQYRAVIFGWRYQNGVAPCPVSTQVRDGTGFGATPPGAQTSDHNQPIS